MQYASFESIEMPKKPAAVPPVPRRPEPTKPPVLMERTQPVIERISAALGEPVFTYWNSTKGAICQNDVAGLYALVRARGHVDRLSLFIKSDGGSGQAALRMVNLLRRYVNHLTVLAPLECQSAATMLALGADRILDGAACASFRGRYISDARSLADRPRQRPRERLER